MTQQIINVGTAINDGTGDPARTAFTKSNDNFTELYARGSLTAPQGRLTLQTGTPVMTTTQAAKTTIFYCVYVGNLVPIWDGTAFVMTPVPGNQLSVVTTDTTKSPAAIGASKVNDWFVWNDAGTVRLSHGPDWTNDTTRSAGTMLGNTFGIWTNGQSITNGPAASRGTYVGTTRSNASSQLDFIFASSATNGGQGWIGVWNTYNRINIQMQMNDSTASWTYAVAAWRSANNSAAARISFVSGLSEDGFIAAHKGTASNPAVGGCFRGVGFDSTTVLSGFAGGGGTANVQMFSESAFASQTVGFHFVSAIEYMNSGTGTFFGNTANLLWSWLDFSWRC